MAALQARIETLEQQVIRQAGRSDLQQFLIPSVRKWLPWCHPLPLA
jgi:hypothetical protein